MGKLRDRLVLKLGEVHPKSELLPWLKGYIPHPDSYIRNSIPIEKRLHYAKLGYTEFLAEMNIELNFDQALAIGALISGDYHTGYMIEPPRFGKSFIMGALANYLAMHSYSVSVVASKSSRTAKVMEHARRHLRGASIDMKNMLVEESKASISKADKLLGRSETAYSKSRIVFKNGNKIDTKSTGDTFSSMDSDENIGEGSHVLIDEMDFISERALTELGRREFERDDGESLILFGISNPRFLNHFHESVTNPNLKDDEFVIWGNIVTSMESDSIKMTPEEVLASDFARTEESIRINLLCEYDENSSEFFNAPMIVAPRHDISSISPRTISALGIDSAYKGSDGITLALSMYDTDKDALVRVTDTINLRPDEWSDARSTREIVDGIERVVMQYNVVSLAIDTGQGSHLIVEMMNRPTFGSVTIYPIDFGGRPTPEKVASHVDTALMARNRRAEMHLVLRQLMQENKVVFASEIKETLLTQMRAIQLKNKELDKVTLIGKDVIRQVLKRSPDDLDAVILAVHALELYILGVEGGN